MNSFGDRWDCHKAQLNGGYHDNKPLQKEWNEYGSDNYDFIVLHDCTGKDLDYLDELEISEIKKYKDLNLAYNLHDGGSVGYYKGKHLSEEMKRKIGDKNRINMTGRKASEKTKKKMFESQLNRYSKWTDEDRKAWGEKMSKYSLTEEGRKSISEHMKNNKHGAKYTVDQVKEIRKLHEIDGLSYKEISDKLGIKHHTVYQIATYKRWKDV